MLLVMVWLQSCLCGAGQLPELLIGPSHTVYHSHGSSQPHSPIPVVLIRKASSGMPKSLHTLLYCFWDCPYYPARFVVFVQLARVWIFFVICRVFPVLLIVGTCKVAQTIILSIEHLQNCFPDFVVVDPACSTSLMPSCSCLISVSESWSRILATLVLISTKISIHISLPSMLKKCIPCLFSAEHFFSDCNLCNAPSTQTISASNGLMGLFGW